MSSQFPVFSGSRTSFPNLVGRNDLITVVIFSRAARTGATEWTVASYRWQCFFRWLTWWTTRWIYLVCDNERSWMCWISWLKRENSHVITLTYIWERIAILKQSLPDLSRKLTAYYAYQFPFPVLASLVSPQATKFTCLACAPVSRICGAGALVLVTCSKSMMSYRSSIRAVEVWSHSKTSAPPWGQAKTPAKMIETSMGAKPVSARKIVAKNVQQCVNICNRS